MDSARSPIAPLLARRSVRKFADQDVTDEQVDLILRAAMSAPTAMAKQEWAFLVVRDRTQLQQLGAQLPNAKMAQQAPLAIVVCGYQSEAAGGADTDCWMAQDLSAATTNLLHGVQALGLGAVWTGVFGRPERISIIREVLAIPSEVAIFALVPIGVPEAEMDPRTRFSPEKVHRDKW
jgi:nitroreductase